MSWSKCIILWSPSFNYNNCLVPPIWKLIQNGVVITSTGQAGNRWSFVMPFEVAPGTARIEVKAEVCCGVIPCDEEDYVEITIGLGQPTGILGPQNICPNSTASFSLAPVSFATSYTWTVPTGWKVNGISGPTVAGQSSTVQITSQTTGFGNFYTIKVQAVSLSCGNSGQTTRQQKLDYPIELHAGPPERYAEFTVSPSGQNSYTWTLPSTWRKLEQHYNEIFCDTRGTAGTIGVQVVTVCNNTFLKSLYYDPNSSFNTFSSNETDVYPNPVTTEIVISDPDENSPVIILNDFGTVVKKGKIEEAKKTIDIRDLAAGTYYLKYSSKNKQIVKRIKKE